MRGKPEAALGAEEGAEEGEGVEDPGPGIVGRKLPEGEVTFDHVAHLNEMRDRVSE